MDFDYFEHARPLLVEWTSNESSREQVKDLTCVIREGEFDQDIIIVEKGSLKITTTTISGETVHLNEEGRGGLVGEMGWLENRPAVASVWAQAGSVLLHIKRSKLRTLEIENDEVVGLLYQVIGSKLSLQIQSQNVWVHRYSDSGTEPIRKLLVLFAELNEEDIDWLRQLGELRHVEPGGVVLEEGEHVDNISLVLAGEARILVKHQGEIKVVGSSRRGELLGEMSILNHQQRTASARVDTIQGLKLLSINIEKLLQSLEEDKARSIRFWRGLARMLSQRSRDQLLERGLAVRSREAEHSHDDEELDLNQLSGFSTAGLRFDWLCRQYRQLGE